MTQTPCVRLNFGFAHNEKEQWLGILSTQFYALGMDEAITIEVYCQTWGQLHAIFENELKHNKIFLSGYLFPGIGTKVNIEMTIPSDTTLLLNGTVSGEGNTTKSDAAEQGFTVKLATIPQTTLWLLESSLQTKLSQKEIQQYGADKSSTPKLESVTHIENAEELQAAESDLIKALWKEMSALSGLQPLEILQCDQNASNEDIRRSFGKLTKKYHPDRFKKFKSDELEMLASELFMAIRNAYKKVGKRSSSPPRSQSAPQTQFSKTTSATPKPSPTHQASANVPSPKNAGQILGVDTHLKKGEYKKALTKLKAAVTKNPEEKKIQSMIEYTTGMEYKAAGDKMEFVQKMEEALSLDPENKRAAFEIAQIRRKAVEDRKALLAKLMKKDKK